MPSYRRARVDGGTYFFTVNTFRRQRFLTDPDVRAALRAGIAIVRAEHPFVMEYSGTGKSYLTHIEGEGSDRDTARSPLTPIRRGEYGLHSTLDYGRRASRLPRHLADCLGRLRAR
ncbi:MAG: hypothetical protein AB7G75_05165 [Candidatus Binatia bacterium]